MRVHRGIVMLGAALALLTAGAVAAPVGTQGIVGAAPTSIWELPPLPGHNLSFAFDVNPSGVVVGESILFDELLDEVLEQRAVKWVKGVPHVLPLGLGANASRANSIDPLGRIGGRVGQLNGQFRAAMWVNNKLIVRPGLFGGDFATIQSLNQQGIGVGEAHDGVDDSGHAAMWVGDQLSILPTLPGDEETDGLDINFHRQVAYESFGPDTDSAVLWQNRKIFVLPKPPGFPFSHPHGLNDKGIVVGAVETDTFDVTAVCWPTKTTVLPLPGVELFLESDANAINNRNEIVGSVLTDLFEEFGVVWRNGRVENLLDFIEDALGWEFLEPLAINDRGEIVGVGLVNGQLRGFLLKLPPEEG